MIMYQTRASSLAIVLSLAVLCGYTCPDRADVRVVRGSTAEHLEFSVTARNNSRKAIEFGSAHIARCTTQVGLGYRASIVWELVSTDHELPPIMRFEVGRVPLGWKEEVPAELPLGPGCYVFRVVDALSDVSFIVDSLGGVRDSV